MNQNSQVTCRIVVFASGEGTNAMNVAGFFSQSAEARVVHVLTDNANAGVIARAAAAGIPCELMDRSLWRDGEALKLRLQQLKADLIVLAGYLRLIPAAVIAAFRHRILNVHPSLLPRHGGKGMWGRHVHEAVIAAGDAESGITIHEVDEVYDQGPIVAQHKLAVQPGWDASRLQAEIHKLEYQYFPLAIQQYLTQVNPTARING